MDSEAAARPARIGPLGHSDCRATDFDGEVIHGALRQFLRTPTGDQHQIAAGAALLELVAKSLGNAVGTDSVVPEANERGGSKRLFQCFLDLVDYLQRGYARFITAGFANMGRNE